jgi:hypothetical protein
MMVRCQYCGQPIWGSYIISEGKTYHDVCFHEHVVPRCAYCQKSLLGYHLIDTWGNKYCEEHDKQYPHCDFCNRLIPLQQQTYGWDDYGSTRCPICRATAIETVEQAQPPFQQCKQWLAQQGFRFNQLPLRLELRERAVLTRLLHGAVNHPLGVTLSSQQIQGGYVLENRIEGVAVLQGMPATLFAGVVLHELGHAWLTVHGIDRLPAWATEGFCQLLSHRYYTGLNTPEARYHAHNLEQSRDPIYGDGFRSVRALAEKIGFQQLMEMLRVTKRLPPG